MGDVWQVVRQVVSGGVRCCGRWCGRWCGGVAVAGVEVWKVWQVAGVAGGKRQVAGGKTPLVFVTFKR